MGRLKKWLGKIVQSVKNIFKRKKKITFADLSDEEKKIVEDVLVASIDKWIYTSETNWRDLITKEDLEAMNKELKFLSNTSRTNLPKPIEFPCAKVVISSHFAKEYEAIIFDMSQYEEKKIAHIISYSPERIEEYFKGEELTPEEIENQCMVALLPGGKVLYYEENDEWDYCFD